MRRIDLPRGGWAEVRDRSELRVRQKHMLDAATVAASAAFAKLPDDVEDLEKAAADGVLTYDEVERLMRIQEVAVVAFTIAWSLVDEHGKPVPLPTLDTVGDMEVDVFDIIANATRRDAATAIEGVNFAPPDPRKEAAPENPTGPPSDSNGHSRDEGGAPLIPPSPVSIGSISSDA